MRRIAHLDMDAFYASVELLRHPELRGQPVAIGGRGDPSRRGVVTTANYEARRFGIRSAMPMRTAAQLCPHCVFLPVDFDQYRRYSRRFKEALGALCATIEDRGIDEVYLDLGDSEQLAEASGRAMALRLKAAVRDSTGLNCSVGVAPNKLLAKIASDLDKPDGLTIIMPQDLETRIWPLPVRKINGIGPKAEQRLTAIGIATIGELAATELTVLRQHFGPSYSLFLHQASHGQDDRPVLTESEPRSRSRETTVEHDLHLRRDWHKVAALLAQLCGDLSADLRQIRYQGRTVGVKVRFDDFKIMSRDLSLRAAVDDPLAIRRAAFECLARVPTDRRIRLIGVKMANLAPLAQGDLDRTARAGTEHREAADVPATIVAPGTNLPLF